VRPGNSSADHMSPIGTRSPPCRPSHRLGYLTRSEAVAETGKVDPIRSSLLVLKAEAKLVRYLIFGRQIVCPSFRLPWSVSVCRSKL